MNGLLHDMRYALRQLRKNQGFAGAAILILALGIGGTTAIFSILNPLLFEPLPYPQSRRIMMIWYGGNGGERIPETFNTYRELAKRNRSFESLAVMKPWQPAFSGADQPERLDAQRVSADYFRVLGIQPAEGRDFGPSDDIPNGPGVVILSDAFWRQVFGADGSILGRQITLDDESYTVIGVMPRAFEDVLAPSARVWSPLQYDPNRLSTDAREWGHHLRLIGRLRGHVKPLQASNDLSLIASTPIEEFPRPRWASLDHGFVLSPLQDDMTRGVRPALVAAFVAVLLVFLIASVNVANLALAQSVRRQPELAMRAALGAGPTRLARQIITEILILAVAGSGIGLVLASAAIRLLVSFGPPDLPRIGSMQIDGTVFLFALLLSMIIGISAGLAPAFYASRRQLNDTLQQSSQRISGSHQLTRRALVVLEVATAIVLLVSTGLLFRSLRRLLTVPPGFDPSHVLSMQVQTFGRRYEDDRIRHQFFQRALDAVRQVPGVRGAAFTSQLPLSGDSDVYGAHFEDDAAGTGEPVYRYSVTPEYFQVLKIALQSGRVLNEQDRADTPRVVVISESLARRRFPNESPIGKRLQIGSNNGPAYTVVGVVDDVKQSGLALSDSDAVYTTTAQWHWADPSLSLVVRSNANVSELTSSIRKTIWSIDKDLPIMRVSLMSDLVTRSEGERHFTVILFELFGIISLALAAIGLYGVQSGDVEERTREIGVRSALGASPRSILILILKRGVALTTVGICIGIVAAAIATRTLRAFLFEITPLDVLTYAGVVALLFVSATAASYIPARRAAKVDPMVALRYE